MHTLGQNRDLIHIHRAHLKTQGTFAICDSLSLEFTASVPKSIGSSTASTTASLIHPTASCIRSPFTSILIFLLKWMAFSNYYYVICLPLISQGNKISYPGLLTGEQYQNTFFFISQVILVWSSFTVGSHSPSKYKDKNKATTLLSAIKTTVTTYLGITELTELNLCDDSYILKKISHFKSQDLLAMTQQKLLCYL